MWLVDRTVFVESGPVFELVPELAPTTPAKPPTRLSEVIAVAAMRSIFFIFTSFTLGL